MLYVGMYAASACHRTVVSLLPSLLIAFHTTENMLAATTLWKQLHCAMPPKAFCMLTMTMNATQCLLLSSAIISARVSITSRNLHQHSIRQCCRRDQADGGEGGGSGGHRGGFQAYSSMVFAQGGVPQQHVTANDMPSPETDVQRNDLAPDASLSLSEDQGSSGGMGSLTGWQALANEVLCLQPLSCLCKLPPVSFVLMQVAFSLGLAHACCMINHHWVQDRHPVLYYE